MEDDLKKQMEDDLKKNENRRRPQLFLKIEDDLNILTLEDDLNFLKMKDNLIFIEMEDNLKKCNFNQQYITGNLTNTTTKNILAQLKNQP